MPEITYKSTVTTDMVVTLPKSASDQLPSRGTAMVNGTIDGIGFAAALEPNGEGSHWFKLSSKIAQAAKIQANSSISIVMVSTKQWPEPAVPKEITKALQADAEAHAYWESVTPIARWDWIRWFDSVKQEETRKQRPQKLCSMLKSGKRRPCCFNRALMTPPKIATLA